jgi:hypothetical protein
MNSALFWGVAQHTLSVSEVSGQPIVPPSGVKQLKSSWTAWRQLHIKLHDVPLVTEPGISGGPLLRVATIRRTTDTFLFISHTTNVLLFKFRCNIFIGVRIIKEVPGSVTSGTSCSMRNIPEEWISLSELIFVYSSSSSPCSHIFGTGTKRILVLFLIASSGVDKFAS